MSTNAPKQTTWLVAVILGVVGIISSFVLIPVVSAYAAYLVMAGFGILAVATVVNGL
ncbi:MAG: hypothetical protein NXI24_24220 [bacterium]|nr:hypothetical protein [bacterium]